MKKETKNKEIAERNPFVAITAISGGLILILTVIFIMLDQSSMVLLAPLAWSITVIAVASGFFALLKKK